MTEGERLVWVVIEPKGDMFVGTDGSEDRAELVAEDGDRVVPFVPLSRALAAEAEVERLKESLQQLYTRVAVMHDREPKACLTSEDQAYGLGRRRAFEDVCREIRVAIARPEPDEPARGTHACPHCGTEYPHTHDGAGEPVPLVPAEPQAAPPSPPVAPDINADAPCSHMRLGQKYGKCPECGEEVAASPVAPEPAQENQGPSGQKENDNGNRNDRSAATEQREAGDHGLGRSEADSACDDRRAESGAEVTGASVGHHQARRSATVGRRSDDGRVAELEAKVAELEKERADLHGALGDMEHAERERLASSGEAAGDGVTLKLEHVLKATIKALSGALPTDDELYDMAQATIEKLQQSRDAERAQKEALRSGCEELSKAWRGLSKQYEKTNPPSAYHAATYEARMLTYGASAEALASLLRNTSSAAQQPTEAAPIAKAEAPSEPVAWVPQPDERVQLTRDSRGRLLGTVKHRSAQGDLVGQFWVTLDVGDWSEWFSLDELEPAPQPPATTGEKLLGPTETLKAEIVAALEKLANLGGILTADKPGYWFAKLAEELERRTK